MKQQAPDTGRQVARAIDALRRGWPIAIDGYGLLAVETADAATLATFDAPRPADLLIAGNRAATLKLTNQREALPTAPVIVARAPWIDLDEARSLADPALDLANPFRGPFAARPVRQPDTAAAALRLARLAGLLPALFVGAADGAEVVLTTADIADYGHAPTVRIASRAHLPVALAEDAEIVAFRSEGDTSEHVALLIGCAGGKPPLVRVHSECLTGDVFGSLKCDCGPQLRAALSEMKSHGGGILLYLRQEGRGIGLVNKLRAYALQDQGFDTVDANLRLGFGDDERDFGVAARMLEALGHRSIRLLTNNPRKVEGLKALGVDVVERVPLSAGVNPHNEAYLATKRDRSGHQL